MTPSELKEKVEACRTESHFFSRANMKFSGDTMSNYGCRSTVIQAHQYDDAGNYCGMVAVEVWELYRKRAVKCGLKSSAYFDKSTFRQVWPA